MELKELAMHTVDAVQVYGLSPRSAWDSYAWTFVPIIKRHELEGRKEFCREIITEYVREAEGRYERGEIAIDYYRGIKRAANRLTELHDTGKLSWTAPKKKSGFRLNE